MDWSLRSLSIVRRGSSKSQTQETTDFRRYHTRARPISEKKAGALSQRVAETLLHSFRSTAAREVAGYRERERQSERTREKKRVR